MRVMLLADPADLRGDAAAMYRQAPRRGDRGESSDDLKRDSDARIFVDSRPVLDAILGTGFKPPVSGLYAEAIAMLNRCDAPVIAVDIPSGADADAVAPQQGIVARANSIVTFTAARPAHVFSALTMGRRLLRRSVRRRRQLFPHSSSM